MHLFMGLHGIYANSYASSLGHTLYFAVAGTNAMGEWVGWDRSSRGEGGGG